MDLVPLDSTLIKGTHGIRPKDTLDWPVILGQSISEAGNPMPATGVRDSLLVALGVDPE